MTTTVNHILGFGLIIATLAVGLVGTIMQERADKSRAEYNVYECSMQPTK